MSARPTVMEVARNFTEYLYRVARGEHFVLMRGGLPVAELTPVRERPRLRDLPALLAAPPHLAPADLDAFESDLEEARAELDRSSLRAPWAS
jgi:antitoxin (DNA-binding transcriptional repressor) of toxin-antitoxin stability system